MTRRSTARINPRAWHESAAARLAQSPWHLKVVNAVREVYPTYPIKTLNKRLDYIYRVLDILSEIETDPRDRSSDAAATHAEPFDVEDARDLVLREHGWKRLARLVFLGNVKMLGYTEEQLFDWLNAGDSP